MEIEVYAAPGQGACDALLDWLEVEEVVANVHDVREEATLAEAIAAGAWGGGSDQLRLSMPTREMAA